jgi:hypothetical protein
MIVRASPGNTIPIAARQAVKIRRAIDMNFYLEFNGHKVLICEGDDEDRIMNRICDKIDEHHDYATA